MRLNRIENTKRNMVFGIIFRGVNILFPFINRTAVLYILGNSYLGLNSLFSSILGILNLAELGVGSAIVYSMYKPIAENDEKTVAALLQLYKKIYRIIGFCVFVMGIVFSLFLDRLVTGETPEGINVQIVFFIQLFNVICSYLFFAYKTSVISAYQREDILSKISIVVTILLNGSQLIILYIAKDFYLYLLMLPITTIIGNILKYWIASKMFPVCNINAIEKLNESYLDEIKRKVKALFLHKIGGTISNSLDNIIISAFLGLNLVAIYNNYYYIILSLVNIMNIFYTSILAGLGNSIALESTHQNYEKFKKLTYVNNLIIGFLSTCLICLYQPFMKLWTGDGNLFEFNTVILLVVYFYINMSRRIVVTFKDATGMWEADKFKPLISGIVNACLNIILIQKIGINGVVISTVIAFTFIEYPWETKVLFDDYFQEKEREFYVNQFKDSLIILIVAIITFGATYMIPLNNVIGFISRGICCVCISAILFCIIWKKRLDILKTYL